MLHIKENNPETLLIIKSFAGSILTPDTVEQIKRVPATHNQEYNNLMEKSNIFAKTTSESVKQQVYDEIEQKYGSLKCPEHIKVEVNENDVLILRNLQTINKDYANLKDAAASSLRQVNPYVVEERLNKLKSRLDKAVEEPLGKQKFGKLKQKVDTKVKQQKVR